MIYTIGIDVGQKGVTTLLKDGRYQKHWNLTNYISKGRLDFSKLEGDLYNHFPVNTKVYLEHSWTQGNQGGTETIWRNYEDLFVLFRHCERFEVSPQTWQKYLGFNLTKEEKALKMSTKQKRELVKNKALNFAKRQEPKIDFNLYSAKTGNKLKGFNDGLSDAYCIAYYGFLQNNI